MALSDAAWWLVQAGVVAFGATLAYAIFHAYMAVELTVASVDEDETEGRGT